MRASAGLLLAALLLAAAPGAPAHAVPDGHAGHGPAPALAAAVGDVSPETVPDPGGTVRATVTLPGGGPATAGCVGLVDPAAEDLLGAVCASSAGVYELTDVVPGEYLLAWLPADGATQPQLAGGLTRALPGRAITVTTGATTAAAVPLAAVATPFPDVTAGNVFLPAIAELQARSILRGYDDGTFRPLVPLTRQAFAAYLARALQWDGVQPEAAPVTFPDVAAGHPFGLEIDWLASRGTIGGYDDGTFRPTATLTRQAATALLARELDGFDAATPPSASPFPDVDPDHPLYAEIAFAAESGLVTGYADGTFRPGAPITRQAVAALVSRFVATTTGIPAGTAPQPMRDFGEPVDGCLPGLLGNGVVRQCVDFPSGARAFSAAFFADSFGHADPPAGTDLGAGYTPGPLECSTATHDRYWSEGNDGGVYRTWHPVWTYDVETGARCTFGHEHGDDPRTSVIYWWSNGTPFGIANAAATHQGTHRHEDHVGHKVVVQNDYATVLGNPPDDTETDVELAGFRCSWLSKVHQGTHSGDAFRFNLHEYQNNIVCDDGAARHPDPGRDDNTGPDDHTEASVRALSVWGEPGQFDGCDSRAPIVTGSAADGVAPPANADTGRQIPCAGPSYGWTHKAFPTPVTSLTGHLDFAPRDAGVVELWKPWMTVTTRDGGTPFLASAYYLVLNPARVYNDGSYVPRRDMTGDGTVDPWIPTLEVCQQVADDGRTWGGCTQANLADVPAEVPATERWRRPESPFTGSVRAIHPKGTPLWNFSDRDAFCTDHLGQETAANPTTQANGTRTCPEGQLLQRVASTVNLWSVAGAAGWGPERHEGGVTGSIVNSRGPGLLSGSNHEWVRFFDEDGVHAPN